MHNFIRLFFLEHETIPGLIRLSMNPVCPGYIEKEVLYVLNPKIFPPKPNGCTLVFLIHSLSPPFQLLDIVTGADYPTYQFQVRDTNGFFVGQAYEALGIIVYHIPVPNARPFIGRQRFLTQSLLYPADSSYLSSYVYYERLEHDINTVTPFYQQTDIFIFFYFQERFEYWACNGNTVCYPTHDASQYDVLAACQVPCYSAVAQSNVYVENSLSCLQNLALLQKQKQND